MNIDEFKHDWRNIGQLDYLFQHKLVFCKFTDRNGDHAHCEFCWEKISHRIDTVNEAYRTTNNRYWICPVCYEEFKDIFSWEVISE